MAPWRGRLGAPTGRTGPASGRHSGPQGRGGEDPNRRDGSRLGTHPPPTDEMAYGQRRNGRNGLEPPPGELGRLPARTRGSAKPARMTRHQASVSAAAFFAGLGVQTDRSCAFLPVGPDTTTSGSRAVPCRPPSRNAGTWPALPQTVSATPLYRSRRTLRFPPTRGHPGTGSPSRRPPSAGCAGRRPAFQAVPAVVLWRVEPFLRR